MFLRVIFIVMLVGLIGSEVVATEVSTDETIRAVSNWLSEINQDKKGLAFRYSVSRVEPIQFEDSIIGRVVFLSPTGWAVLPAWKEQQPLVAYSFEGAAPNSLVEGPIGFVSGPLLGQYRRFVLRYGDVDSSPGGQKFVVAREMWAAFLEGAVDGRTDPVQVGPLLDSNWHQNAPFNNLCPIWPGDGERSFAGCVAIAMAQIMKYHEWPVQGEGSSFYFWEGIIQISAHCCPNV